MVARAISFGPFRLLAAQRLLLEGDKPVRLGSRAFDILAALIERAGNVVGKEELIGRAWPRATVEESNLKLQISALRRALGDGQHGHRYVLTVPGRGYNFVAPVNVEDPSGGAAPAPAVPIGLHNLPVAVTRMIGREDVVAALTTRLARNRLVTIVGPGGIGKTTVALAVAERVLPDYEQGIWMVDLAPVADARLVPSAVMTVLGLESYAEDLVTTLVAALRDRRMLLLLDNCEHVIEATARLASAILGGAPEVRILATSREPPGVAGESNYRLRPLDSPSPSPHVTAAEAAAHAAVQLFVERVMAVVEDFALTDANAPLVADICRKLDGLPLAIEFAAPRVAALGLDGLAARLDNSLRLLAGAHRTATPRHRTMRAVLDWSYGLLDADEQRFFRALGVFSGGFTVETTVALAADPAATSTEAINRLADLVMKSLVAADVSRANPRFRLLDTTRAYALEKLQDAGELDIYRRRYAGYLRDLMQRAEAEWDTRATSDWLAAYAPCIDDIRAALDWAFSPAGDATVGVALTAAAVPLFFEMWLLEECRARAEHALAVLEQGPRDDEYRRMQLYAAVASSQAYTVRSARDTRSAWQATLEIASRRHDTEYTLRALWGTWGTHINRGEFREGLAAARRFSELAATASDTNDRLVGDRLTGAALHFLGDQRGARDHIERMLDNYVTPTQRSHALRFQSDQRITGQMYLARIRWLQGFADQAQAIAAANVEAAQQTRHPQSLCNALAGAACPVALLTGDLAAARRYTDMLLDQTEREVLELWHAHALCFEGELLIRGGEVVAGLQRLNLGVGQLDRSSFGQYIAACFGALTEGLLAAGRTSQAAEVIDDAVTRSDNSGGCWYFPELLRFQAATRRRGDGADGAAEAEACLLRAIASARAQSALAWELRAATDLARLWRDRRRAEDAHMLLSDVLGRFVEGFETTDLRTASALLREMGRKAS